MPKKKWTSRRIARDITVLLVVLCILVMTPVAYLASQARRDISEQFIHNATSQAVAQFQTMTDSMKATLGLVRDWVAAEGLSFSGLDALNRFLFPIFGREKLLHGISIADIDGSSYYVHRAENGYQSSFVTDSKGNRVAEQTSWNLDYTLLDSFKTNSIYDPRNRPWFFPALAREDVFWTDPYKFFTGGDIGITASISYIRERDEKQSVVAFDILLDDMFKEIHQLAPSDNSLVYVFSHDSRLYMPETENMEAAFVSIGDVGNALLQKVQSSWFEDQYLAEKVISVLHEGEVWWCGFRPLDGINKKTWICVMVPESDIMGHAGRRSKRLWMIGFGSVFLVTALAYWMIRRYANASDSPDLFSREDPQGSVRRIIAGGENRYVEFKSTMRMNLHTKKPGKEIEMAWMKGVAGFLNTDGGILLIGVTDDGEITGLERDVFESEDKCRLHFKNLISKHIGADLSKYIRFILVSMDGKTVGVVRCDRSEESVFVKDGNKEHFYIRNGPSSDELPVSQALNYIKHRE